ncbi:MAG: polynucleotide adenylyltransferase PcnB [Planctomycetota bacterium]|nr:MAG: polynucleotide adenylyltransferase PcnB [Planctomycetota bacterium]
MSEEDASVARPSSAAQPQTGEPAARVADASGIPATRIHQDALRVVSRLSRNGHEAYLVGGCVRDLLLGRSPKDFDVATAAHPRQIRALFRNARIIGRRFRLAHVVYGDHIVETATFRTKPPQSEDEEDDPLIREDNAFGTAVEDALRRDFTINGLFLDPLSGKILDYVGGLADLEAGVLRTIGDPVVRIAEDPVRILRAIKFATRLGFRIDEATWSAMIEHAPLLTRSAPARVVEEILRLLHSGTSLGAFRMLRACGALAILLPEIDDYLGRRDDPDPAAHDRADQYWRLLEALDSDVHAGRAPSRALALSVVWLRIVEREAERARTGGSHDPGDLYRAAEVVLDRSAASARLPRKDTAIARKMISDQPRFALGAQNNPRTLLFLREPDLPESLNLLRLRVSAWGQGWDVYEGWLASYEQARALPDDEVARLRNKKRRRRRGRGRGAARSGGGEPS